MAGISASQTSRPAHNPKLAEAVAVVLGHRVSTKCWKSSLEVHLMKMWKEDLCTPCETAACSSRSLKVHPLSRWQRVPKSKSSIRMGGNDILRFLVVHLLHTLLSLTQSNSAKKELCVVLESLRWKVLQARLGESTHKMNQGVCA